MSKTVTFAIAVERTLGIEDGYVNNPRDPGGETKWGISKREYPDLDIASLTRDDAKAIYKRDFWDKCGAFLHDAVMFQVFDAAVNHGIGNAIRMLQRAVDTADDGYFGPYSQSALANMAEAKVLMRFLAQRLRFMRKLSRWADFGRGWADRIATDLDYAAEDL
jgi:lysozyme family protein